MFAVEVRDHVMIAHSLPGEVFGPAQALHGATYVVDAAFFCDALDPNGLAVDIALATRTLGRALDPLRYANLDTMAERFGGLPTTTEVVARHLFDTLSAEIRAGALDDGGRVNRLRVSLEESHVARAFVEAAIER